MLDDFPDDSRQKPKRQRKPKAPKEPKPKTWEVSYEMYRGGMKPDLIAHERSLTLDTILGHLVRYVESGDVSFDDLVPPEHQRAIERIVQKCGTADGITPIKNLCPPDITFSEIRLVMERMQKNKI